MSEKIREVKNAEKKFESYRATNITLYDWEKNSSYLEKVVADAYAAEQREPLPARYVMYRLPDGHLYAAIDGNLSPYARVVRRVQFRLDNNRWIKKRVVSIVTDWGWGKETEYWLQ